ncbi:efflux RND transporter periplasmic adaptor subunit [Methylocaldum sp.]|uniref:efflux RND transporter periplasmic adaptor subunit n=1 Tax=Methylocaldum sp. TaxID=1969727 RepID=UPI002D4B96B2|nr:efflux RND transporter periplasmic adaptor subunit [Methylocaldum sp.]HYE36521.1 efflux RND transporter periplasmic adaptor subunit [Methylocaldum sp.]
MLWLLVIVGVVGVLVYSKLRGSGIESEVATVGNVFPSQAFTLLNATGYVVPQTKADVASKATGRLERLDVEEGSYVKKDQILAQLENRDLIASLNQAAANVAVAKTDRQKAEAELKESTLALNRLRTLVLKKFVSQELYDAAIARHEKAVAAVESAKSAIAAAEASHRGAQVSLDYTFIRAPFDGVILSKHADIGDILAPFSSTMLSKGSVVSMADMNTLEVEVDVAESNLNQVSVGQPCEIQLDALPDDRFRCAVDRIVPTVDRTKATVLVKVRFIDKNDRILPDMSAKVAFLSRELTPDQQKPLSSVPDAAIVTRGADRVAFVLQGKRVKKIPVETGEHIGDLVVVKKGLKTGDQVVLSPSEKLKDGAEVRIREAEKS